MPYSIIIPIHNEEKSIPKLLYQLKDYSKHNEILIINDGSNDNSKILLENSHYISLYNIKNNSGKGAAIKIGLKIAKYNKIILFDGDLELKTKDINKLMILDYENDIDFVLGYRFNKLNPFQSFWDFGNFLFTLFFNLIYNINLNDALCCAKSFYKKDIIVNKIKSKSFDIDIELTSMLIKKNKKFKVTSLDYKRRTIKDGKKLRFIDSIKIFIRIIKSTILKT